MNPYENISDPVEMLKVMYREKEEDCRIKNRPWQQVSLDDVCGSLEEKDTPRLHEFLKHLADEKRTNAASGIATSVKLLTKIDLHPFLEILVEKKYLGQSPFLFQGANSVIRDKLIERVSLKTDWVLHALAWIGDDEVLRRFTEWRDSPPDWSKSLFVTADQYSLSAGWELTHDGQRRELCYADCIPVVLRGGDSEAKAQQLKVFVEAPATCPLCQRNLLFMFSVHPDRGAIIQHPAFTRTLEFLICEACIEVSDVLFSEIDATGDSVWVSSNSRHCSPHSHDDSLFPRNALKLDSMRRNPYYAAAHPYPDRISQVGGHPTWLQDAEYPQCPECRRTMMFFGQLAYEDFDLGWEGTLYAFTCEDCKRFLATRSQCT